MSIYDEIEIEDMTFDEDTQLFTYPCPCGDRFQIFIDDLVDGSNTIAVCPSCSLQIQVIFEASDLEKYIKKNDSDAEEADGISSAPDLICA